MREYGYPLKLPSPRRPFFSPPGEFFLSVFASYAYYSTAVKKFPPPKRKKRSGNGPTPPEIFGGGACISWGKGLKWKAPFGQGRPFPDPAANGPPVGAVPHEKRSPASSPGAGLSAFVRLSDPRVRLVEDGTAEKLPRADLRPVAELPDRDDPGIFALGVEDTVPWRGSRSLN